MAEPSITALTADATQLVHGYAACATLAAMSSLLDQTAYPANTSLVAQRSSMRGVVTGQTVDDVPQWSTAYERDTITTGGPIKRYTVTVGGSTAYTYVVLPGLPTSPLDDPSTPKRCAITNNGTGDDPSAYVMLNVPVFLTPRMSVASAVSPTNPLRTVPIVIMLIAPQATLTLATVQLTNPGVGRLPANIGWTPPALYPMSTAADGAYNTLDFLGQGPVVPANTTPTPLMHPAVTVDVVYW